MKLLVITQKVDKNDPILGFFHRWLEGFAKNVEKLTVICLEKGEYELPENVKVLSLGKEGGRSRIKYLFNFYRYIWRERKNYDAVFVHMNPEYVILGWADWKILGKKIALWYVHKYVSLKLRIAKKLADEIFTASRESFRLPSKKISILGHGIDTEFFKPDLLAKSKDVFRILSVSRISRTKNIEKMILVVAELKKITQQHKSAELAIVGSPVTAEDEKYLEKIKKTAEDLNLGGIVNFLGAKTQDEALREYQKSNLFLNFSSTGSLDKAVLEAMSSGVNILTSNEAFFEMLPKENIIKHDADASAIVQKIIYLMNVESSRDTEIFRQIAVKNHDLKNLVPNIIKRLEN